MNEEEKDLINLKIAISPEKYMKELLKENQELKKQLKIKNDGFMASVEETCEYATILDELEKWLEEEIKHYKEHFEFVCKSPSPVPIDDTKIILEKDDLIIQKLEKVLNKLQELKGSDPNEI